MLGLPRESCIYVFKLKLAKQEIPDLTFLKKQVALDIAISIQTEYTDRVQINLKEHGREYHSASRFDMVASILQQVGKSLSSHESII